MILERDARSTLTPFELDPGDELHFRLAGGEVRRIRLVRTRAAVDSTTLKEPRRGERGARTVLRMHCDLEVDGVAVSLVRWVGNDRSFQPPWELFGMRLWFDACDGLFEHLNEAHGPCRPRRQARFAVQDRTLRICPPRLHPWCPLPEDGLRISDCYDGSDCWLGPYFGADAHGGLDLNHPAGTRLWAPLRIDEHGWFAHLDRGDDNNRWRGLHHWGGGVSWALQSHHLIRLLVPEGAPIEAGVAYAESAGIHNGSHEHTHFVFAVIEEGVETRLDPWILFWQMYEDAREALRPRLAFERR